MMIPDTTGQSTIQQTDALLDELRTLIGDLGKDGGIISPSVYDTAQVLRFYPPEEGVEPVLEWLLSQQQADGGWGDPAVPLARDMPTLAAVLALHELGSTRLAMEAVDAGLRFIASRTGEWTCGHIDLIPIAAEIIIPWMLQDVSRHGLHIDPAPYIPLFALRDKKKTSLSSVKIEAGSGPTYSWEALGLPPDPDLVDIYGSIGHSPAATARWLQLARYSSAPVSEEIERAEHYLRMASIATDEGVSGVVPTVWPLPVFEDIYGLLALSQNGLVDDSLSQLIQPSLYRIHRLTEKEQGLSFSEHFISDVDCTSVGSVVLAANGISFDSECILNYRKSENFYTFAGELNPSVFSNAHALAALSCNDLRLPIVEDFLLSRQLPSGAWMPDKWHSSWLYTTLELVDLMLELGHIDSLLQAKKVIVSEQSGHGYWGVNRATNVLDTSYAVMSLRKLDQQGLLGETDRTSLWKGHAWLLENYEPDLLKQERLWMGKELYSPYRVDQLYVLSSILSLNGGRAC